MSQFARFPVPGDREAEKSATSTVNVWLDTESTHLKFTARRDAAAISQGIIRIRFPYSVAIVRSVKEMVPGRTWNAGLREWNAAPTPDAIKAAVEFANANSLSVDPGLASMALKFEDLPARRIVRDAESSFEIHFAWDGTIAAAVRNLPGREWNGSFWTVPAEPTVMKALVAFGKAHGFDMEPGLEEEAQEAVATLEQSISDSKAESGTIEIPNFGQFDDEAYPFQKGGIEYILSRCDSGGVLVADEMGLGKTIQFLGAVAAKNAFPAIVVCPASLKENWRRETQRWLPGRSVVVLTGSKPMDLQLLNAHVYIINYDILDRRKRYPKTTFIVKDGVGVAVKKGQLVDPNDRNAWIFALAAEAPRALGLDESQYCKGQTIRTKACKTLAKSESLDLVLLLTGTPVMNRPSELITQLQIMRRLEEFGGWKKFTSRYCQAFQGRFGYNTDGAAHLEELNAKLRQICMVRRLKVDVLTELPPKIRTRVVLPLSNRAEYNRAEEDVIRWIGEQAEGKAEKRAEFRQKAMAEWDNDRCVAATEKPTGGVRVDQTRAMNRQAIEHSGIRQTSYVAARARQLLSVYRGEKEARAASAEQLVRIEALKQVAVRGMMSAAMAWIADFLETGEPLVAFASHVEIVKEVAAGFDGAGLIYGATKPEARTAAIDAFQAGSSNLIVGNLQAMGVGYTLTAASNVVFLELGWNPAAHDQCEDRCHRIGQEDSVTAHYLLPEGTIYEEIERLIAEKRAVVEMTTDGKTSAEAATTSVLADLVETLRKKGG